MPEPEALALRYHRGGVALWILGIAWGLFVPAVLLLSGFSAKLRTFARGIGRNWYFTIAVYVVLFSLLMFAIDLPLNWYEGYAREHAYGLSNQTPAKWFGDAIKSLIFGCLFGVLFLWVPYLLLEKSPRRWWLYTGLGAIPLIFLLVLIQPVWIDPFFNEFGPMKDQALEARILALADRAGIEGGRVFEVAKSADTKTLNAYVNGFLGTKRIVLWDTTIARMSPDELLFVMGHEMGHYVLGHVWKTILFLSGFILLLLWLAHRTAGALIARFRGRFGFDRLADIAALPLLLFLLTFFSLFAMPVVNGYSRWQEHEADRFGLELTRNNHAAATAFVKLMTTDLGVPRPNPVVVIFRSSHPPLGDRIDFCNSYMPWRTGQPMKYDRLFKPAPGQPSAGNGAALRDARRAYDERKGWTGGARGGWAAAAGGRPGEHDDDGKRGRDARARAGGRLLPAIDRGVRR